ncbi:hypothetical protein HY450_00475 [Candidatus Pacearchaeota archaeon]|nr:hypothetical protein [Candidatus Pacearchaeota archaeon]
MFPLEVDGESWGYVFVEPDACLNWEDRENFLRETVRLDREGEDSHNVKGEYFEGKITRGKYCVFGQFSGVLYEAELETNKGKRFPSTLVMRRNSGMN